MKSLIVFVISAFVATACAKSVSPNNSTLAEIFRADFSKSSVSAAFDGAPVKYGGQNVILWASGLGIEVIYPAGSYSPEGPIVGGFGIWTRHRITNTARFKFSVFFPAGFNFWRGGKLPGLYGGKTSCAGGDPAVDCFSARVMWRDNGEGELYLYANREAQDPIICQTPPNYCAPEFGWSLNRGAFRFPTNEWTEVEQRITLNTPGQRNGILSIKINGVEKVRYNNLVFRVAQYPNMVIDGIAVDTFFGGGSDYWATPVRQISKFRDFILYSE